MEWEFFGGRVGLLNGSIMAESRGFDERRKGMIAGGGRLLEGVGGLD